MFLKACNGHPDVSGTYHIHLNPICMYNYTLSTSHSPIIGWAFDSYPIYGPFGYSSANNSNSSITRITSGYKKNYFFSVLNRVKNILIS